MPVNVRRGDTAVNKMLSTDRQRTSMFLPTYLETLLNMVSMREGVSKSQIIRALVEKGLDDYGNAVERGANEFDLQDGDVERAEAVYRKLVSALHSSEG